MCRAEMNVQRRTVPQCPADGEPTQAHIDPGGRRERPGIGQPIAAPQRRPVDARQIQGAALAR